MSNVKERIHNALVECRSEGVEPRGIFLGNEEWAELRSEFWRLIIQPFPNERAAFYLGIRIYVMNEPGVRCGHTFGDDGQPEGKAGR